MLLRLSEMIDSPALGLEDWQVEVLREMSQTDSLDLTAMASATTQTSRVVLAVQQALLHGLQELRIVLVPFDDTHTTVYADGTDEQAFWELMDQ